MASTQPNQPDHPPRPPLKDVLKERLQAAGYEVLERLARHPVRNALVIAALSTAVVGLGVAMRLIDPDPPDPSESATSMAAALRALDAGDLDRARDIAANLRLADPQAGGPAYVLGVVLAREAVDQVGDREGKIRCLLAAHYLEDARQAGLPPGREAHGLFILGKCYHDAGQFADCLTPLHEALDARYEDRTEVHRLLMTAYLRDTEPQYKLALDHSRAYLSDDLLGFDERCAGLMTQSEILFQLDDATACEATLSSIPQATAEYPRTQLLRARALLREGDRFAAMSREAGSGAPVEQALKSYTAARELLALAQQLTRDPLDVRKAQYLTGLAFRKSSRLRPTAEEELVDLQAAAEQFVATRRANFDSAEGLSAALEEAEIHQLWGDDAAAMESYHRLIDLAKIMVPYDNPWLSWGELQTRLEAAYHAYREAQKPQHAISLARALPRLLPEAQAVRLQAEAHEAAAAQAIQEAASLPPSQAEVAISQARMDHRQAAVLYSRLANLRAASREYPSDLWNSATNYLRGQDYRRAVGVLERYLEVESPNARPPALTALGEALLALNKPEEALPWLTECIHAHAYDPHSYRARILAAQAQRELGDLAQAKALLEGNLQHESLTPRSLEWRESLFDMGQLCYLEGIDHETQSRLHGANSDMPHERKAALKELELAQQAFHEAIRRLSEAVQRDPDAPQAMEARYLIAESHRQAAKLPRKELPTISIETTVRQLNEQINHELTAAEAGYSELLELLNAQQEHSELSEMERRILRNCYFARADALYDMERYEEAIQAYSDATNRYQHEPESLEAYVQIANCHRRRNRLTEARGTLEQAKVILQRIRPEADFTVTTRYNREEWSALLDWLSAL